MMENILKIISIKYCQFCLCDILFFICLKPSLIVTVFSFPVLCDIHTPDDL